VPEVPEEVPPTVSVKVVVPVVEQTNVPVRLTELVAVAAV